jgi:hypothetical protein
MDDIIDVEGETPKKTGTDIHLESNDAALVIKEGETNFELYLPEMEDPEAPVPDHILVLVAIACRLKQEEFVNDLIKWFEETAEKAIETAEDGSKQFH